MSGYCRYKRYSYSKGYYGKGDTCDGEGKQAVHEDLAEGCVRERMVVERLNRQNPGLLGALQSVDAKGC